MPTIVVAGPLTAVAISAAVEEDGNLEDIGQSDGRDLAQSVHPSLGDTVNGRAGQANWH